MQLRIVSVLSTWNLLLERSSCCHGGAALNAQAARSIEKVDRFAVPRKSCFARAREAYLPRQAHGDEFRARAAGHDRVGPEVLDGLHASREARCEPFCAQPDV